MEPSDCHTEILSRLAAVYRCVETASKPRGSPVDVARWMFPLVCGGEGAELTRISVTVVGKIASCVTAERSSRLLHFPPEVASYFTELLKMLFDDLNLMSHLVSHFDDEDQILSHLAAKSASARVLHLLYQSGVVCPVWQQKCLQSFDGSTPGRELDACLWSLTEVLKRLLEGAHGELLVKVLRGFDCSLCALTLQYLPGDEPSRQWGTTLCLLLDLLEVLTASSVTSGPSPGLQSQRLTFVHSVALLQVTGCCTQSFVRRRVLLLLKRALLQRAGEDWSLGGAVAAEPTHLGADVKTLSDAVLAAVAAGWMDGVRVDAASFFGGTEPGLDPFQRPDCVTLRAVGLLFLKSMELRSHSAAGTGLERSVDIQQLWSFLRRSSSHLQQVTHLCCWLSLLFGEQDDDMMEAAQALLSLFLHHRRRPGCNSQVALEAACGCGCNPHCHFLLLLQSVSFDHSVLLDFLISSETCFLLYLVRYLRFLLSDPPGFAAACRRIDSPDRRPPEQHHHAEERSAEKFRLVEYPSSEESDQDETDCQGQSEGLKVTGNVKEHVRIPTGQNHSESSDPAQTSQSQTEGGRRRRRFSLDKEPSCPSSKLTDGKTVERSVECLSQLRLVVTRLQARKLFPYNPSSLLKLLTQVDERLLAGRQ